MELVKVIKYELDTRPFQCNWDSCNRVSVLLILFLTPLTYSPELQPQVRPLTILQNTYKRAPVLLLYTWLWQELHPAQCPDYSYSYSHW